MAIAAARLSSTTARSDYEQNIVALLKADLATRKHLGLVCSAFPAYQRAMALTNQAPERRFLERRLAELLAV